MSEILINITTTGLQHQPAIATLGSTHFFVVWLDSSDLTIKGRLVQANGNMSGGEFVVNTPTPDGSQHEPAAANDRQFGLGPDRCVDRECRQSSGAPSPCEAAEVQPGGATVWLGNPGQYDRRRPRHRPAITGMIDGGFLVSWMDARPDQRIRAQRFGFDGSKKGPEFRVNTTEGFHQAPIATRLFNGNYVIAWRSDPSPPGGGALIFRIFDLAGSPIVGETRPNLSGFTGQKAMTFLDDTDDSSSPMSGVWATATLASPRAPWRRTCSSLTALLPIFRFLPPADKR